MWIFLILFLPCFFAFFCIVDLPGLKIEKKVIVMYLIAAFLGIIFITVHALLILPHYEPKLNFFYNVIQLFLRNFLIPVLVCGVLFFILSTNYGDFSIDNCFALLMGFYSVFIPYSVVSNNEYLTGFQLFFVPVLYGIMLLNFRLVARFIINMFSGKINIFLIILTILGLILLLFMPYGIESMWCCGISMLWISLAFVAYIGLGFLISFFACKN